MNGNVLSLFRPLFRAHRLLLPALLFLCCLAAHAAFLRDVPQTLTQPNGDIVHCFATGDEYYHRLHDANGFTIVQDPVTGYFVYAVQKGDGLAPSSLVAGKADPEAAGLAPNLMISQQEIAARVAARTSPAKAEKSAPKTGTINNIIIFIRFAGETEFGQTLAFYNGLTNNTTAGAVSMRNYYWEASYNNLTIVSRYYPATTGSVVVSWQDSHNRNYFRPYNATTNTQGYQNGDQAREREHTLLKNAVEGIRNQISSSLNLDGNNDGQVDNVTFICRGNADGWADLLWPHWWQLSTYNVTINNKRVFGYNLQVQTGIGVGVFCHEMFHSIGAPDLYHYTNNGRTPIGPWDLMEWDRTPPQHMCAYMKQRYGTWISSIQTITTSGTYSLNPLTSSTGNCFRVNVPGTATEYFVLEYRRKTGTFENSLPASGLVVYRVNTTVTNGNEGGPPDELYVYRPGGTAAGANGTLDSAPFSRNAQRTMFNSSTNPTPFLVGGGAGGLDIYQVSETGGTITFNINIGGAVTTARPDGHLSGVVNPYWAGDNVYNTLSGQTVTRQTAPGGLASFLYRVQNDGNRADAFRITGLASGGGWTIRYFDAEIDGNDITAQVTNGTTGYETGLLSPGAMQTFRVEITAPSSVADASANNVDITATSLNDMRRTDVVRAIAVKRAPLTAINLTTNYPSPTGTNGTVRIFAYATGGGSVENRFEVGTYIGTINGVPLYNWTLLRDYSTYNWVDWTPTTARTYRLLVHSRESGFDGDQITATRDHVVLPQVSAVSLVANPPPPGPGGASITLTATPTNGGRVEYKFRAGYRSLLGSWNWTTIRDYSTANTCTWVPSVYLAHTLVVMARECGSTAAYMVTGQLGYQVVPPLTGVSLICSPPSPSPVGTRIRISGEATGGVTVQYQILVGYYSSRVGGYVWTTLKDWSTVNYCNWTPPAAITYMVAVNARERDFPGEPVSASTKYFVRQPLAGVSLATSPVSPSVPDARVLLTATPTNGAKVEYQFSVGTLENGLMTWVVLSQYSRTATCSWTPKLTGDYTLEVAAREEGSKLDPFIAQKEFSIVPRLSQVTLAADPPSPALVGTNILLTATPRGGAHVEYLFKAGYKGPNGWVWTVLQNYGPRNTCTFAPKVPNNYTLVVYAREIGYTGTYEVYTPIGYVIK